MGLTYPSNKICPRCGTCGYVWYMDNSKYIAKCINCGHYFRKEDFPICVLDKTHKAITKADKIRTMTDDELAGMFDLLTRTKPETKDDSKLWLDWLKQEVEQ